ncbi:hypothetical protein KPATCC21470_4813 [Kitasatospora purpeofusca]
MAAVPETGPRPSHIHPAAPRLRPAAPSPPRPQRRHQQIPVCSTTTQWGESGGYCLSLRMTLCKALITLGLPSLDVPHLFRCSSPWPGSSQRPAE